MAKTLERFGKLDFLVNNGGGQFVSPVENISTMQLLKPTLLARFCAAEKASLLINLHNSQLTRTLFVFTLQFCSD